MCIYQPYTYRISWSKLDKHYYGVRYAKNCNPNDFWKTYFTSSKLVKEYRELYGDPDIIEIRRTFKTAKEARLWEEKVLKKLNVFKSNKWLNICISGENFHFSSYLKENYTPWNKGKTGIYSEETIKKMSETKKNGNYQAWNKGKTMSDEYRQNMSHAIKEKWKCEEYRERQHNKKHYKDKNYRKKLSESIKKGSEQISKRQSGKNNSFYGKKHTEESNEKRREKLKGLFWWTDGQTNVRSKICPSGFYRGKSNILRDQSGKFTF